MNEWYAGKLISADKRFVWSRCTGVVVALETPLWIATKAGEVLRLRIGDLWNRFVVEAQKDAEEITA